MSDTYAVDEPVLDVIESQNSTWYFDQSAKEYMRVAKPRRPTRGLHTGLDPMEYDVWLPYTSYSAKNGVLNILYPGAFVGIVAYVSTVDVLTSAP